VAALHDDAGGASDDDDEWDVMPRVFGRAPRPIRPPRARGAGVQAIAEEVAVAVAGVHDHLLAILDFNDDSDDDVVAGDLDGELVPDDVPLAPDSLPAEVFAEPPNTNNAWATLAHIKHVDELVGPHGVFPEFEMTNAWRLRHLPSNDNFAVLRCIVGKSLRADCVVHGNGCKLHLDIKAKLKACEAEICKWGIAAKDVDAEAHHAMSKDIANRWRSGS
jgi:hypothetical protein